MVSHYILASNIKPKYQDNSQSISCKTDFNERQVLQFKKVIFRTFQNVQL